MKKNNKKKQEKVENKIELRRKNGNGMKKNNKKKQEKVENKIGLTCCQKKSL